MKKFLASTLFLVLGLTALNAHAIFPPDTKNQALYTKANNTDPLPGIGSIINYTKNLLRVTYDTSVLATSGSVFLVDDHGNTVLLPYGALVTNVVADVITQPLPSTSSVSLGLIGSSGTDLMAQKAQSSLTAGAFVAGAPIGTAATWVGPVTSLSLSNVGAIPWLTVTGSTLTAGKIEFFIEYVIQ